MARPEMRTPKVPVSVRSRPDVPFSNFQGGESVLLMNVGSYGYWKESIFTVHGRSVPVLAIVCYMVYASAVTAGTLLLSPFLLAGAHDAAALKGIIESEDEPYFQIHEW
jgi:hypothetical protein